VKKSGAETGFTLVELLVVIAIIGIVLGVAATTLLRALPDYRLRGAARELLFDLQKARMEAVKRKRPVLVEFAPQAYSPVGERGSYTICVDDNGDGLCDPAEVLVPARAMPKNVTLTDAPPDGFIDPITFAPDGPLYRLGFDFRGLPTMAGRVRLINNKGRARMVEVSTMGRISVRD
jgi:prepilin-type N-terminal cleavage/methylation domain-containing protein